MIDFFTKVCYNVDIFNIKGLLKTMKKMKKIAVVLAATLSANMLAAMSMSTASAAEGDVIGTATLKGQMGTYAFWGEGDSANSADLISTPSEFTEEGTYTSSWTITGDGTSSIEFLILEFETSTENFITQDTYPDLEITIDSVVVDGTEVAYTTTDGAINYKYYANDTGTTRVYLTDTWGASGIGTVNDLPSDTAVTQSIEVTYTIKNLYAALNYGDVDGSGEIDTFDAFDILSEYASISAGKGSTFDEATTKLADVTGDGSIDTTDAFYVLRRYAQIGAGSEITPFPVEEQ